MVSEIVLGAMRAALEALGGAGVEPVLVGGLAIQRYQRIRQTKDADFLALYEERDFERVFQEAESRGLRRDAKTPVLRIGKDTILRLFYEDPRFFIEIRIDVIQANDPFLRSVHSRAESTEVFGLSQRVARCEDLILMKLVAGRALDRADAADLLRLNRGSLDLEHVRRWADDLGIAGPLSEALAESEREPT